MSPPFARALAPALSPTTCRFTDDSDKKSPFSSRSSRALAPAAGHGLVLSSQGAGRRLDGGLLSVAEVAASIFQCEKWEGTGLVHHHRNCGGNWCRFSACVCLAKMPGLVLSGLRGGVVPSDKISGWFARVQARLFHSNAAAFLPKTRQNPRGLRCTCSSFLGSRPFGSRHGLRTISAIRTVATPTSLPDSVTIPSYQRLRDLRLRSNRSTQLRPHGEKIAFDATIINDDQPVSLRTGTAEQHEDLIRRVSVGRSGEQAAALALAREVFEGNHPLRSS